MIYGLSRTHTEKYILKKNNKLGILLNKLKNMREKNLKEEKKCFPEV